MGEDVPDYHYNEGTWPRVSCLASRISFELEEALIIE